jgi:tetratricopeptide (TPR) repeat protein
MTNDNFDRQTTSILEIEKGNQFKQQGQLTEAVNCYRQAISIDPLAIEAYQLLALTFKQQGNLQEAANYYRQVLELKNSAPALVALSKKEELALSSTKNLIDSAFSFQSLVHQSQNRSKALIEFKLDRKSYFASLILSGKNNFIAKAIDKTKEIQTLLQKALTASEEKNWAIAILSCQQALKIDPTLAEAYKILGNSLQRSNQSARAMECYAKAIDLQPDLAEVYASIGDLYTQDRKWQQAIDHYQKALVINPKIPNIYRSLSNVWHRVGEPRKALECIYRAVQLEPEQITSEQQLVLGDRLLKQGKINQAIVYYRRALELNANSPQPYRKIAALLEKQERWKEASAYYRRALELNDKDDRLDPSDSSTSERKQLSDPLQNSKLLPANTEVDLTQLTAIKPVQHLLKSRSVRETTIQAPQELTEPNNLVADNLDSKIQEYLKKARLHPHSAILQSNLGNLYAQQKDWERAIAQYEKAIELDENLAIAHRNLAKVMRYVGRQEESVEHFYRAVKLKPSLGNSQEHLQLGHSFLKQGKKERAIQCYRNAIELDPNFIEAYHCLGETFIDRGEQQEAIDCYRQAIAHNPQDLESQYRLAKALTAKDELASAISCYQKLIEAQSDRFEWHYDLADLLRKKELWYEAIKSYHKAIELNPSFPWSYYYLGSIFLTIKRWQKAVDSFEKAIELNPNFLWSYYYLAEAFTKLENWDGAIAICRNALDIQPDFFEASQKLNQALAQKLMFKVESEND